MSSIDETLPLDLDDATGFLHDATMPLFDDVSIASARAPRERTQVGAGSFMSRFVQPSQPSLLANSANVTAAGDSDALTALLLGSPGPHESRPATATAPQSTYDGKVHDESAVALGMGDESPPLSPRRSVSPLSANFQDDPSAQRVTPAAPATTSRLQGAMTPSAIPVLSGKRPNAAAARTPIAQHQQQQPQSIPRHQRATKPTSSSSSSSSSNVSSLSPVARPTQSKKQQMATTPGQLSKDELLMATPSTTGTQRTAGRAAISPLGHDWSPQPVSATTSSHVTEQRSLETTANTTGSGKGAKPVATMREQEALLSQLQKENFSLKLKIYYLEESFSHLDSSTANAARENADLKVENELLQRDLAANGELLTQAQAAIARLRSMAPAPVVVASNNKDTSEAVRVAEENAREARDESARLREEVQRLTQTVVAREKELEGVAQGVREASLRDSQVQQQLVEAHAHIRHLEEEAREALVRTTAVQKDYESLKERRQEEAAVAKEALTRLRAQVQEYAKQPKQDPKMVREISELRTKLERAEEALSEAQETAERAQERAETAEGAASKAHTAAVAVASERVSQSEYVRVKEEARAAREKGDIAVEELGLVRGRLADVEEDRVRLEQQTRILRDKCASFQQQVKALEKNSKGTAERNVDFVNELSEQREYNDKLQKMLTEKQRINAENAAIVVRLRQQLARRDAVLERVAQRLESSNVRKTSAQSALGDQIDAVENTVRRTHNLLRDQLESNK